MTSMARMAGNASPSWCPYCHRPPGPDCPDRGKSARQVRRTLKRELEDLVIGEDDEGYAAAYAEQRRIDIGDDFFEEDEPVEDEPVEDVLAAFEAGEKVKTAPPAGGKGWCAPSP